MFIRVWSLSSLDLAVSSMSANVSTIWSIACSFSLVDVPFSTACSAVSSTMRSILSKSSSIATTCAVAVPYDIAIVNAPTTNGKLHRQLLLRLIFHSFS